MTIDIDEAFAAIDWETLDVPAVKAFYAASNRPPHEQVLLFVGPVELQGRSRLRRQCLADLAAMNGRVSPGRAA